MNPELCQKLLESGWDYQHNVDYGPGTCRRCSRPWTAIDAETPCIPNLEELMWAITNVMTRTARFVLTHECRDKRWGWGVSVIDTFNAYVGFGDTAEEALANLWIQMHLGKYSNAPIAE